MTELYIPCLDGNHYTNCYIPKPKRCVPCIHDVPGKIGGLMTTRPAELRATEPRRQKALEILKKHPEGITPLEASYKYGCYALSTYISDLRLSGYNIEKEHVKKNVWRYRLVEA